MIGDRPIHIEIDGGAMQTAPLVAAAGADAGGGIGGVPGRLGCRSRALWREHTRHPRGRRGRAAVIWRGATALAGAALDPIAPLGSPRLARTSGAGGAGHAPGGVWLHAASLGELASVRVLASDLARDLPLVVTTNTTSGRDLARRMGHACARWRRWICRRRCGGFWIARGHRSW